MAMQRSADVAPYLTGPAYGVGLLFVLMPVVDTFAQMWPPALSEPSWRYGTVGIGANYLASALLGMLLMCLVAGLRQHRRTLRVLAILNGVFAVVLLLAAVGFILDVLQVRYSVPKDNPRATWLFNTGAVKAELKYLASAFVLAWLALSSRRAWRAIPQQASDEAPKLVRQSKAGG
jgi:threonine/homoserine/homoserine lactone efflux protein